jgi:hypothetical protein
MSHDVEMTVPYSSQLLTSEDASKANVWQRLLTLHAN